MDGTVLIFFMCLSLLTSSASFHISYHAPHRPYFYI